ncbi:efflux RND transporter periplasmic adaptor subunit [uncultured Marixanthomonas sp.]|uniref:efflux RND transporter periplasmic adaptor subunit n=1 Tax=uncultured Marixanthomonas sp. TaxID=757245 RepID=UPI0030DCA127|tara:strand:- start:2511 stop:4232 length:1722 start_codon:yes stop_codon:yes gene_type:complete
MKKYIIYFGLLLVGLLLGFVFFGNTSDDDTSVTKENHNHSEESQQWTCSMHPQIMQPEPGDCPICGMDLIPAETTADGLAADQFTMTKNAMALANIQTTVVGSADTAEDDMLTLSGKIMENEEATAIQPAHFNGRIERLYVNTVGETVKKGQAVATIYSPELVSAQQELITAYRLKESQPKLYEAVRKKLHNWKIHGPQLDKIERTGEVQTYFTIYSHVSGVVTELLVKEGAHIMDGKPIFRVSNLNTVWASFDVYEGQISQIDKDQPITITTNAYPNKEFTAKLSFVDPLLNTQTRTVSVRATLNNSEGYFKPGMFVSGKIKGVDPSGSLQVTVPSSAVLWTGERSLIYIKTGTNPPTFQMREVTLGAKSGDTYIITDGLVSGDEIVTNGTFTVDAAAQLQGKKSMMNRNKVETEIEMEDETMKVMELSESFQKKLKNMLPDYFSMKDAFVNSNALKVSQFATELKAKLGKIVLTDLGTMEQSHVKKTNQLLGIISESNDLENQRSHFVRLNETMIPLLKNVKGISEIIFIQKCPMANTNKGASWLSNKQEIRNPYFGEAMMTCGSVIDSIQ